MQRVQFFETTVADRDQGYTVRFITLPRSIIAEMNQSLIISQSNLLGALGFERFEALSSLYLLPHAIAVILQENTFEAASNRLQKRDFEDLPSGLLAFAVYVAFAKVVPFTESPIDLKSFAGITTTGAEIAKGHPLAVSGVSLGIVAAAGATGPALLSWGSAGIIVCFAAEAVGVALQQQILKLGGVPDKAEKPPVESKLSPDKKKDDEEDAEHRMP